MPVYTVHEAKTHLSKLIERAERGEEVIIARGDKPAACLTTAIEAKAEAANAARHAQGLDPHPRKLLRAHDGGGDP